MWCGGIEKGLTPGRERVLALAREPWLSAAAEDPPRVASPGTVLNFRGKPAQICELGPSRARVQGFGLRAQGLEGSGLSNRCLKFGVMGRG